MSRVYWDSMLFIYLFENNPRYADRASHIINRIKDRGDVLCTGTLTLTEVLTGMYRRGHEDDAARARQVFERIEVLPFTVPIADTCARIRARFGFSISDAIHLATAADARTDVFVTNDNALVGKSVPGVQFIVGIDTDLF
ncbi:MAG: PIN domain-containing protein [Acidobacteria bacterium]|nr:PIN domain-containing protein [Acidobacteriota bacterium]